MDYKKILNSGSMGYNATLDAVRKRDNYTCQKCDRKWKKGDRKFDVHHLNEYEGMEKAFRKDHEMHLMVTLCHKCHTNLPEVRQKMSKGKGKKK